MANIGTVSVGVEVDATGVPEQVQKTVTRGMQSVGSRAGELFGKGLRAAATGAAAAAGTLAVTAFLKGFRRLDEIDTARTKLVALGNSTDDVAVMMDKALKAVKGTAFGLNEAASAAAGLASSKVPLSQMDRALGAMVSTAALANVPLSDMSMIFNKVASNGKLTGETLAQLLDRQVPVLALVQEEYGVTAEAARDMVSRGEVDFERFIAVMSRNADAAKTMGTTFSGLVSNVGAAIGRLGAGMLGSVFEGAKIILPSVISLLDQLTGVVTPLATSLGDRLLPYAERFADWLAGIDFAKIGEGSSALAEMAPLLAPIAAGFLAIGSSGLGNALSSIPLLGKLTPMLTALGSPLGVVLAMITGLVAVSPELRTSLGGLLSALVPLFIALAEPVGELALSLVPLLVGVVKLLTGALAGVITWVTDGVRAFTAWVQQNGDLVKTILVGVGAFVAIRAAMNGFATIMAVVRGAQIAMTVAQWAMNSALLANPIGIVIAAVAALVAALVWFFTQTKLGKDIVENVTKAIGTAFTWLNTNVIQPVVAAIVAAWNWMVDAAKWVWENVLKPVFDFIGAGIQVVGAVIKLAVDLIVNYFRFWAAVAMWVWENAIKPALDAIGKAFDWLWKNFISPIIDFIVAYIRVWAAVFAWLYENVIKPIMSAIGAAFKWVWETFIQPIVDYIKLALVGMGIVFTWLYENIVKPVWEGISKAMQTAWNWINTNVFTPFKTGIDLIAKGFEIAKSSIEKTWDGIKKAAAVPINFVLDTVWNKGLRSFWNGLVDTLGLKDMRLPAASLVKFAKGGVLPGYTPGRDVHQFFSPTGGRLALSGGEGIIRPDALRALGGKKWLDAVNKWRGRGAIGDGPGWFGDTIDWVKKAAGVAWDFISDPVGAIEKHIIQGILNPGTRGQNIFGKTVGGLAANTVRGLSKIFQTAAPQGGVGMGWQAMWDVVRRLVPGAYMTSNYRPGARTVNGGQSYHSLGRAIDIGPATMAIFNQVKRLFPRATELIFTPAGSQQLQNGRPSTYNAAVAAQHWNHIHLAMKKGGIFDNGGWMTGLGLNMSGKPEAVFTAAQFATLERNVTQMDSLLRAVRGYQTVDLRRSRTAAAAGLSAESGPSLTIEAGAFALSGSDPYKVSYDVVDRIAEKVGL